MLLKNDVMNSGHYEGSIPGERVLTSNQAGHLPHNSRQHRWRLEEEGGNLSEWPRSFRADQSPREQRR